MFGIGIDSEIRLMIDKINGYSFDENAKILSLEVEGRLCSSAGIGSFNRVSFIEIEKRAFVYFLRSKSYDGLIFFGEKNDIKEQLDILVEKYFNENEKSI